MAAAALVFLAHQGRMHRHTAIGAFEELSFARTASSLLLYIVACLVLSLAWPLTLRGIGSPGIPLRPLAALHLRAQLSKYLPGGVFHFAQRHIESLRWGFSHGELTVALAAEAALLLGTASLVAVGIIGDPRLALLPDWLLPLTYAMPLVLPVAWLGLRMWSRRIDNGMRHIKLVPLLCVVGIDLAFFLLSGLALLTLGNLEGDPAFWLGWLALAWLCGYLVPGAPGGIGIRETVLVLGLAHAIGSGQALALALAYRVVTLSADGICTVLGFLLSGSSSKADGN
ncbi:hypothetical protein SAMN05428990_2893 [Pseudoxanthomonas sp. YR558]|nr:hypothetical protein SAMN05428990_2893 [Pseudoxanthomonas sp. YR558]